MVEGTFLVNSFPARILFDLGASHFFISHSFMLRLHLVPETLDLLLPVATPLGDSSIRNLVYRRFVVILNDVQFSADLIVFHMLKFDIILDMDCLSSYHVSLNCFAKTNSLRVTGEPDIVVATSRENPFAEAFLAHMEKVLQREQSYSLGKTGVISEFYNVFQDIPGLPPMREIEFSIEL